MPAPVERLASTLRRIELFLLEFDLPFQGFHELLTTLQGQALDNVEAPMQSAIGQKKRVLR